MLHLNSIMSQSQNKRKVLIICNSSFAYKYFLPKLENGLLNNNFEVNLLIGKDAENKNLLVDKTKTYFVKMPIRKVSGILSFFPCISRIRKILRKNSYDYIIANNRDASFCARLSLFLFSKKRKNKMIYFARGFYFHDSQNYFLWIASYLIEVLLLFETNIILSQSKEDLKKIYFFLKLFRIKYYWVGNGVSQSIFYQKKFENKNYGLTFTTTCRITKGKGLEDLIWAFNKLLKNNSNSNLIIIGGPLTNEDNIYFENLKKSKDFLEAKNAIKITGFVENVADFLRNSDFYIHPSYREGVPRSLLEAMSVGLIVLSSEIRGAREIIKNNYNGILYKMGHRSDLYENMLKLINYNMKLVNKLRKNSLKTIDEFYTEDKYLERQIEAIKNI